MRLFEEEIWKKDLLLKKQIIVTTIFISVQMLVILKWKLKDITTTRLHNEIWSFGFRLVQIPLMI
jgi:hypothetical protein